MPTLFGLGVGISSYNVTNCFSVLLQITLSITNTTPKESTTMSTLNLTQSFAQLDSPRTRNMKESAFDSDAAYRNRQRLTVKFALLVFKVMVACVLLLTVLSVPTTIPVVLMFLVGWNEYHKMSRAADDK